MRISLLAGVLLVASLTLAGCNGGTRPDPAADAATVTDIDAAAACRAQGGELRPLGRLQRVQCVVAHADAGRTCNSASDCTGHCLAIGEVVAGSPASGVCQRDISENFGCRQRIDGGVAQPTICVD